MIKGYIDPDFSRVVRVFEKMVPRDAPGGAALCVFHRGRPVLDVWSGTKNIEGDLWQEDTLALSFSTTKGVASTLLHILADRGQINYDAPIATYWPEFAQEGKYDITVRHLLTHESGMYDIRGILDDASQLHDWDTVIERMSATKPEHAPGILNVYHGITYGFLVGEIIQRVTGKSFAAVLKEELADPLELDGLYVGMPEEALPRRSILINQQKKLQRKSTSSSRPLPTAKKITRKIQEGLLKQIVRNTIRIAGSNPHHIKQGLLPRGMSGFDFNSPEAVQNCMPSMNGMFTARSLAAVYAMMAAGGTFNGKQFITPETLEQASTVHNRRRDRVVLVPMHWRLGYHRVFTTGPKTPHAFGHFGYGGSGAWCDPSRDLAVAMTLNWGVGTPFGDMRLARINTTVIRAAEAVT